MKNSKRVEQNNKKVDRKKEYALREALELLKNCNSVKFDETVEAHINLGVDPRHADQNIRGTVSYPHGTGRKVRVLVLTKSKVDEAIKAGADFAGLEEYIEKIQGGWADIDIIVATPDVMGQVGKLGKVLGPKGLMPNPKSGTVTNDVAAAVKEVKAGRVEVRVDKTGIIHTIVGKKSFPVENLEENLRTLVATLMRLRPQSAKGIYLQKVTLTTTMGPGVRIDKSTVIA
ncbi:MAG: 50S ribosomal protein L1 [Candidatus Marinimicrobia bacterium]|jgi:large subunit ribosomal protein L1|nr:50S ribosomal protein L1 [Candidatus Neomarinimicrobiota bacterium]MCK9559044.1 50S ribosomal protein L1 [Candidatus Neomarinimicrobiota bacterium]MDD5060718.1 50S ribosomal protein L1 [Candidatus Neomarinimicrobiota bacterium]MDD5230424.1 50S ribosomal protein L1 [Candidatus Neomarinimicrobiota bacterium]MDD5540130.1 50S ribosomal protein L1 [Candidatus Neomarinimicrobiota bacterium]